MHITSLLRLFEQFAGMPEVIIYVVNGHPLKSLPYAVFLVEIFRICKHSQLDFPVPRFGFIEDAFNSSIPRRVAFVEDYLYV